MHYIVKFHRSVKKLSSRFNLIARMLKVRFLLKESFQFTLHRRVYFNTEFSDGKLIYYTFEACIVLAYKYHASMIYTQKYASITYKYLRVCMCVYMYVHAYVTYMKSSFFFNSKLPFYFEYFQKFLFKNILKSNRHTIYS